MRSDIADEIDRKFRQYESPAIDTDKDIAFSAAIFRDALLNGDVLNKDERAMIAGLAKISMDLKRLNVEEAGVANDRELLSVVTSALADRGHTERPKLENPAPPSPGRKVKLDADDLSQIEINVVPGELDVSPEPMNYAGFINDMRNR